VNDTHRVLSLLALVAACGSLGYLGGAAAAYAPPGRVIRIVARRFAYSPDTITVKKGQAVTLEFVTRDVLMGFNAPDIPARTDIPPGAVTRITFTPQKAGTFPFLCDIFCGSGHETMNGTLKVVD
jgi:cytochrome c oxidase subunit 2